MLATRSCRYNKAVQTNQSQPGISLAPTAAQTTRDNPWPLSLLTQNIKKYVSRMSRLWVCGQVVEYKPRPGSRMAFFVLRDTKETTSMTVKCFPTVLDQVGSDFSEGAQVVVLAKPDFYEGSGSLSLFANEVHTVGVGNLLAQIEQLRKKLAAEGLFLETKKQPLPAIPDKIGLIVGRNAKAKQDVMVNALARWPLAEFEVREVAVQGPTCAQEVTRALQELDFLPEVEVIVISRGGGAVEDLLPFSEESLVRAAAAARTPLVSAIGHEEDAPLLDFVADYRASTPTDAARRIVPDLREETLGLENARSRLRTLISALLDQHLGQLASFRARPVMADPAAVIAAQEQSLALASQHLRFRFETSLQNQVTSLNGWEDALKAYSPQAILERGYSILRSPSGSVINSVSQVNKGDLLEAIFPDGSAVTKVFGTNAKTTPGGKNE